MGRAMGDNVVPADGPDTTGLAVASPFYAG
ncbi:MAG: hypothetical protein ACJAR2_003031 [Ilumatobacter sp.]|jgi:hypothetical protein